MSIERLSGYNGGLLVSVVGSEALPFYSASGEQVGCALVDAAYVILPAVVHQTWQGGTFKGCAPIRIVNVGVTTLEVRDAGGGTLLTLSAPSSSTTPFAEFRFRSEIGAWQEFAWVGRA